MQIPYLLAAVLSALVGTFVLFFGPVLSGILWKGNALHFLGNSPAQVIDKVVWTWAFFSAAMLVIAVPIAGLLKAFNKCSFLNYLFSTAIMIKLPSFFFYSLGVGVWRTLYARLDNVLVVLALVGSFWYMVKANSRR